MAKKEKEHGNSSFRKGERSPREEFTKTSSSRSLAQNDDLLDVDDLLDLAFTSRHDSSFSETSNSSIHERSFSSVAKAYKSHVQGSDNPLVTNDNETQERRKRLASMRLQHEESTRSLCSIVSDNDANVGTSGTDANNSSLVGPWSVLLGYGNFMDSKQNQSESSLGYVANYDLNTCSNHSTGSKQHRRNSLVRLFRTQSSRKVIDSSQTGMEVVNPIAKHDLEGSVEINKPGVSPLCKKLDDDSVDTDDTLGAGKTEPLPFSQRHRSHIRSLPRRTRSGDSHSGDTARNRVAARRTRSGEGLIRPRPSMGLRRAQSARVVTKGGRDSTTVRDANTTGQETHLAQTRRARPSDSGSPNRHIRHHDSGNPSSGSSPKPPLRRNGSGSTALQRKDGPGCASNHQPRRSTSRDHESNGTSSKEHRRSPNAPLPRTISRDIPNDRQPNHHNRPLRRSSLGDAPERHRTCFEGDQEFQSMLKS